MAKEILDENILRPSTIMSDDFSPEDQPQGANRYVLNGVNQTSDGDKYKISTEQSNSPCGSLANGYLIIGKEYINDGRTVLFCVSQDEYNSEIGIIDKDCNYITQINDPGLNFKLNHQIQSTYRSRRGCEDISYFTDGYNPMRVFNFTKPHDYYTQAYKDFLNIGGGSFTGKKWDIDKLNLFPSYKVPCFTKVEVTSGGTVLPGTYNFGIRLLDGDFNPTNFIYSSQLVPVFQANLPGNYWDILGSSVKDVDTLSGIANTTKAIKLTLSNLDTEYKYYQIAVISATDSNTLVSKILVSPNYPISSSEYIFDGNIEGYTESTSAELLLGKIDIDVVEHLEQLENKLILSSIKGKTLPYCSFQSFASKISSNYIISEAADSGDSVSGSSKNPNTYWNREGYMGDEIYAMGIVYVFKSGLETPSYHIPGRSPGQYRDHRNGTIHSADDQTVLSSYNKDMSPWYPSEVNYNALPFNKKLRKWQVYDTSVKYSSPEITESFGAMSYWQSKASTYNAFTDCEGQEYWGVDACGVPLQGKPIRHHKFPSRFKECHIRGGAVFTGSTGLYLSVSLASGQTYPTGGLTITINYDINGTPGTYNNTIMGTDLPIYRFLIDEVDDDFNAITINSVTGSLTDDANKAITNYQIFKDVLSSVVQDSGVVRNLGIQFSNIEYPHPDIVGHYFVRGARDDKNRTVLDKGVGNNLRHQVKSGIDYTGFAYFTKYNQTGQNLYLLTPRFLFNKESLTGDYIKYENEFTHDQDFIISKHIDGKGSIFTEVDTFIDVRVQAYNGNTTTNGEHNYKIDKSLILDGIGKSTTFEGPGTPVYNLSWSNKAHILHTTEIFNNPDNGNMPYLSYKIDQDVHPVLADIIYQRTHNCMLTPEGTNIVFGGDTFINNMNLSNSLYRKQHKGIIGLLLKIVLTAAAVVATIATAGAGAALVGAAIGAAVTAGVETAIVVTAVLAGLIGITGDVIQQVVSDIEGDLGALTADDAFNDSNGLGSYVAYANEYLQSIYVESEVNIGLRQTESHVCGDFYRYQNNDIGQYFINRWMYFDQDSNNYLPKGYCCPEIYHYNKDYSRQNLQSLYFPLAETYDCCSDCSESHPNRVQYSLESFQEELSDNYRVFLPNNYRDIESEHGKITNVIKRNNNLFIHTSEALWALPQSQEERVTGELVTFIGTGEFFSIPPKKITDDEIGTVGSKHKWATLNTDKGLLFIDESNSKIYLYENSFKEISKNGKRRWFRDHLVDSLARQFKVITQTEFPNQNNPANPYGVGIHSVYDKKYERIIITKRDYLLRSEFLSSFRLISSTNGVLPALAQNLLVFDLTTSKFILTGVSPTSYQFINLDNVQYFENKSWTISYSIEDETEGWVSYHSYIPNSYFYNHDDFYSTIYSSNQLWKHNQLGSFLSFYGKSYSHVLEVVLKGNNPSITKYWDDISLQTIAKKYNTVNKAFFENRLVTFDKFIAYNNTQTTGLQLFKPKEEFSELDYLPDTILQNNGEVLITRREQDWNFNDLRDYRINYNSPIFTKSWDAIKGTYFTDKVLDPTTIDFDKDWTELQVLRDKFVILRFIFDNFTDTQLSTNYITDTSGTSMR